MEKYERIEELGLKIVGEEYVYADELEAILRAGLVMYGVNGWFAAKHSDNCDTHSGLLINIKPIEKPKPVTAVEIKLALNILDSVDSGPTASIKKVLERILKDGVEL